MNIQKSNQIINPIVPNSTSTNPINNASNHLSNTIKDHFYGLNPLVLNSYTNSTLSSLTNSLIDSSKMSDCNQFMNSFLINPITTQYSSPFVNLSSILSNNLNNSRNNQFNLPFVYQNNQSINHLIDQNSQPTINSSQPLINSSQSTINSSQPTNKSSQLKGKSAQPTIENSQSIIKKKVKKNQNRNVKKSNLKDDNQQRINQISTNDDIVQRSTNNQISLIASTNYDSSNVNDQITNQMNNSNHIKHITNQQPINYSDLDSQDDYYLSDSEFEFYYSSSNLYDNKNYFDNRMFKCFVVRYGNQIRLFKPVCVVKDTKSLLCNILGTYCLDSTKMVNQQLPVDFIWPLNSGKHDENVQTIRRLIKENPIPDQLPIITTDIVTVKPFALNEYSEYFKCDKLIDKFDKRDKKRMVENNSENKEPNKKANKNQSAEQQVIESDKFELVQTINSDNLNPNIVNNIEKHQTIKTKPYHCPYCFKKFSASFNVKMHFFGRHKNNSLHISCPVSKLVDKKTLKPVICKGGSNCELCLKSKN